MKLNQKNVVSLVLDLDILQNSCMQDSFLKMMVKLIAYLFLFVGFHLYVIFKLIKFFSNARINSKRTIYKSQFDSMSGILCGSTVEQHAV